MSESIGMMDKAYFVGKVEILNWFNTLLQVSELTETYERSCSSIWQRSSSVQLEQSIVQFLTVYTQELSNSARSSGMQNMSMNLWRTTRSSKMLLIRTV